MNEDVKRIGDLLQGKRRELNLSLKEVENATSIRSSYLEAIEAGTVHQFISGVYALGFIKQYAQFLGFDVDQLARDYAPAFRLAPEKHEFAYGIGTLEVRGSLGGGVKWFPNLLWAGAAALVLLMAWYLAKSLGIL
jgi:cytoskeletal protein RodZ